MKIAILALALCLAAVVAAPAAVAEAGAQAPDFVCADNLAGHLVCFVVSVACPGCFDVAL